MRSSQSGHHYYYPIYNKSYLLAYWRQIATIAGHVLRIVPPDSLLNVRSSKRYAQIYETISTATETNASICSSTITNNICDFLRVCLLFALVAINAVLDNGGLSV